MMPYLDAAFAFALTMLAVATLVTQIVRLIRNASKVRRDGLQKLLEKYYKTEFQPVINRELNRLTKSVGDLAINDLRAVLAKHETKSEIDRAQKEKLDDIPTEELLERLKRSELGQKLLTNLGDKAQSVFDELGKRYEIIGKEFTESFRKGSRIWATVIALVLAFIINIDSIHIANTYIQNDSMRQTAIAQKDAFVEDYNALAEKLTNEQDQTEFDEEDLEKAFKDSREQLNVVMTTGFPIGWSYFPHSYFEGKNGTSEEFKSRDNTLGWLMWVLGILLTGGLAGLGGPFWYDAVAGISRVVQKTRAASKKPEHV